MAQYTKSDDFKDSDKDGLSDQAEAYFGTDPNNPDSDGDGMSDRDEVVRGRNPNGPGMLKDLFIPHAGNNYHPRSLHPKRVLFHAASALAIKAAVIMFMLGLPATAWLTPDILREQQQKIITLTNSVRQSLGIAGLSENTALNQSAFNKAQDLLIGQYFAHTSPGGVRLSMLLADAGYEYSVAGENLAMGFADAESVVNAWVKSPTHYANMIDASYRDIGVGLTSGLYDGYDTTLVAQHFGAPLEAASEIPDSGVDPSEYSGQAQEGGLDALPKASTPPRRVEAAPAQPEQALGAREIAEAEEPQDSSSGVDAPGGLDALDAEDNDPAVESVDAAPIISIKESVVYVAPDSRSDATIVRAEARIAGASEAVVLFNNNRIQLEQSAADPERWTGSTIIFETDESRVFNPVVLPVLQARAASGALATEDISWDSIVPVKPSLMQQYFFMKQQDSGVIHSLLTISSLYFTVLLALAIMALGLMVFIEIKKQRPKHIASGLGLIALLVLAIML